MKKQETITQFIKQARIENYSEATVKNYASALKLFYSEYKTNVSKISDDGIQNFYGVRIGQSESLYFKL